MTQLRSIDISELDFDQIKANLKAFLQDQEEFTDYDFEGSGLSILLDILSYNTHYNAYLANMLANEMFLDSAVKRSSAVSIAKHLGYTPNSTRSARAFVDIQVTNPTNLPDTLTLGAKTSFNTTINGNSYTFFNLTTPTAVSGGGGIYTFRNVELVEGSLASISFVSATPGPGEKFELPDTNIDTTTLTVSVQTSASNTTTDSYVLSTDTSNVTSTSKVFFLDENPTGRYEIYFGDGTIGKKLTTGNIVRANYLRSLGSVANTSNTLTTAFTTSSVGGSSNVLITVNSNPSGGKEKDTITDIKFNAPKINAARNRAVTTNDYEALIYANFSGAESVSVWGGEENVPPVYGKVFISLKPFDGFIISQLTKDSIKNNVLKNKKVLAITPEFVDPEYFYVNIVCNIEYDTTATTKTIGEIEDIVRNVIQTYFSNELQKFNKNFKKSRLIKLIMDSDTSISSAILLIKLQKRYQLSLNSLNTFIENDVIKLENPINPGTFSSSRFYTAYSNTNILVNLTDIPGTMPPDPSGTGRIIIRNSFSGDILFDNVGTINYGTGEVSITGFTPTSYPSGINDFRVTGSVQEEFHNLEVNRNQILLLDRTALNAAVGREAGVTINVAGIIE